MPVIQLSLTRLGEYCKGKASEKTILESLPYLGLDIEDHEGDTVSVEYSPNRPDYCSEAGIARSLVGLLGIETGLPEYNFPKGKFRITVANDDIRAARPIIQGFSAEIMVTDDLIKQLITLQEDLHNGIGRRRSKVAIGIHNAAVISTSLKYYGTRNPGFSFVPLGGFEKMTVKEICQQTDQGLQYGKLLSGVYPILEDSNGNVLSMPPIINGELTRLKPGVSKLFVDLTGTDQDVVDTSTAIIASMISDVGGSVQLAEIVEDGKFPEKWTPDMTPKKMRFDLGLANDILGFNFTVDEARAALEKSRLSLDQDIDAMIPRFRHDVIHPVDLAEEVALGYGVAKITPQVVSTSLDGELSRRMNRIDLMVDSLVGLGLTEVWNLSLTSREIVENCGGGVLKVDDAKSQSYEYLRCALSTTLLRVLGESTHQEYPQKIFEIAPVFSSSDREATGIRESEHVAVAIAGSSVDYSIIRSIADAFLRLVVDDDDGRKISFKPAKDDDNIGIFASGRTASLLLSRGNNETSIGLVGEVHPAYLEKYRLGVPVAGFELDLEPFLALDKD